MSVVPISSLLIFLMSETILTFFFLNPEMVPLSIFAQDEIVTYLQKRDTQVCFLIAKVQ